ncbi:MAG: energy transducer TonB [Candidatus Melainabacteria bacterium]
MPLIASWVFRKNKFISFQLLQSALCQLIPFVLSSLIFGASLWDAYNHPQMLDKEFELRTTLWKVAQGFIDWPSRIILFFIALRAFSKGYVSLFLIDNLAENLVKFFIRKSLKKSILFNSIWPGLGHVYIGKNWFGWILATCHLVTFISLAYLTLAHFNFSLVKDLTAIFGFYFRMNDQAFIDKYTNWLVLGFLITVFCLNYLIGFIGLPIWKKKASTILQQEKIKQRNVFASFFSPLNWNHRRVLGSFGISYIVHLGILWTITLIPFVFNQASFKESVNKRAEQIQKQLEKLKKAEAEKKKDKDKIKPATKEELKYRELQFDLQIPEKIKGINEFNDKKFQSIGEIAKPQPTIGFQERTKALPNPKTYKQNQSRETKSYSEYITAKVRESGRDKLIWSNVGNPFSNVVQYTIDPDGNISDIEIIESSGNLKSDSYVIAVLESMSPVLKSPNGKKMIVTELFWNTGGNINLRTNLQNTLVTYPDGRLIEESN